MTNTPKHGDANGHGSYERQDLQVPGILYFLLALIVVTALCMFGLRGVYAFLERRQKALETPVNPLVNDAREDTRHVAPGYPQSVFPNPTLEEDERGQLNDVRLKEERQLYTYGWVDEKAGMVHIPIERAMDLIVQRGLPVRAQGGDEASASPVESGKKKSNNESGVKKAKKK